VKPDTKLEQCLTLLEILCWIHSQIKWNLKN